MNIKIVQLSQMNCQSMSIETSLRPKEKKRKQCGHTVVTVQGQLVTTISWPLVAVYSQSLKVSVVASLQTVVNCSTTTTEVTVVLKYAHTGAVPFLPAATDDIAPADELVAELVAELEDCAVAPAARTPATAMMFVLKYILVEEAFVLGVKNRRLEL